MARSLVTTTPATNTKRGDTITPAPTVEIRKDGVLDADLVGGTVKVRLANPGSATLLGTLSRSAAGGVIAFDDLVVDGAGTFELRVEVEEASLFYDYDLPRSIVAKLRHWWPLSEPSGEDGAHDLHGGQTLVVLGAQHGVATVRTGGDPAIRFTGDAVAVQQGGTLPAVLAGETIEVAAWVRLDASGSVENRAIASSGPTTDATEASNIRLYSHLSPAGDLNLGWEHGLGTDVTLTFPNSPAANQPYLFSFARDGATKEGTVSIDGVAASSQPYEFGPTGGDAADGGFWVGNRDLSGRALEGALQDLAIFGAPLTPAERAWLYNAGAGRSYNELIAAARVPVRPTNEAAVDQYQTATEHAEPWDNFVGWTNAGVQLNGNRLYGIAGANPSAAVRAFPVAAGETCRIVGRIWNNSAVPKSAWIGFLFGGTAPEASSPTFVGVGVQSTNSGRASAFVGTSFTDGAGITMLPGSPILTSGFYDAMVEVDGECVSLTLRRESDGQEWSLSIPRTDAPNGGAITAVLVYNGDSRALTGNYVEPIGYKKATAGLKKRSAAGVVIEGARRRVRHRTNGWRIQVPRGYDGRVSHPLCLFIHQASTGTRNSPWSEARMAPVNNALERHGYFVASADDGQRWGNMASQDNYANLVSLVRSEYNISYVVLLGASMGGLAMLNLLRSGVVPNLRAAAGIGAVCDLEAMYLGGSFTAAIEAAYEFSGPAQFPAATAGFNPMTADPGEMAVIPIRYWASPGDVLVPKAAHSDALVARIASVNPDASVVDCTGGHLDVNQYRPAELLEFFEAAVR